MTQRICNKWFCQDGVAQTRAYKRYRNDRRRPLLMQLPNETFFQHGVTGFEGAQSPPSYLSEFYEDILAWAPDVYHHDGDHA